jgi:hypothetical protein
MTVERADLSTGLRLERMAPVASAPAVQGQSSPQDAEDKPRRRPSPPEKASAEPLQEASEEASEEASDEAGDEPQHRIDSLA